MGKLDAAIKPGFSLGNRYGFDESWKNVLTTSHMTAANMTVKTRSIAQAAEPTRDRRTLAPPAGVPNSSLRIFSRI